MEEKIRVLRRGCVVYLWHCLGLPNFCDRVRPCSPMRIFIRLLPAALIGLFSRQVGSWEFAYGKKGTVVAIHFHYEHTSSLSLSRSPTHSPGMLQQSCRWLIYWCLTRTQPSSCSFCFDVIYPFLLSGGYYYLYIIISGSLKTKKKKVHPVKA